MSSFAIVCRGALCAVLGTAVALGAPEKLKIVVLEGQGAINNIRERSARAPVVRVEDENDRPVAGVSVRFVLPEFGAGGSFGNGQPVTTTLTGKDGRATAWGLRPNNVAGQFTIQVSASFEGLAARATITQTNAAPAAARSNPTKKIVIAGLVAGAVAGVLLGARGGGSSGGGSSPGGGGAGATTITPGSPVFGPPR